MKILKDNIKAILICATSLIPLLVIFYYYNKLPDMIPTHWNIRGDIDGYTTKKYIFFIPVIAFFLDLFIVFRTKQDPKNIEKNKLIPIFVWIIPILCNVLVISSVFIAMGYNLNITVIVKALVGIILVIAGNYMPKTKQNYTIGIRTPWTLDNEIIWDKTHRFAGKAFMFAGLLCFLSINKNLNFLTYILFIILLLPSAYSFYLYRKNI